MSHGELERMTRRYASEISIIIGPEQDIPAPDVYTNAQTMAWIMDTFSMTQGHSALGVVTGKPLTLGGSAGRNEATARGALFCIREACVAIKKPLKGAHVAIQGYGNAGAIAAQLLHEDGARVVAVSDSGRGLFQQGPGPGAGRGPQGEERLGGRLQGRRAHHQRGAAGGEVRHPGARRAGEPDHAEERQPRARAHRGRGRQRAHHARRRPRAEASTASS